MSEIKLPENYSDIVVMAAEPLKGYSPDVIREMATRYKTDAAVAAFMAAVSNKTGWLRHALNDPDSHDALIEKLISQFPFVFLLNNFKTKMYIHPEVA